LGNPNPNPNPAPKGIRVRVRVRVLGFKGEVRGPNQAFCQPVCFMVWWCKLIITG